MAGDLALFDEALDQSGTGFLLTDPHRPDHPIVYVNQSFLDMTGYAEDEVLGRNCRFLQGADTDPEAIDELRRAIAEERSTTVHLRNYRKDGTPFWNEVHIAPVRDADGTVARFVGVQVDVTAYREPRALAEIAERRSSFLANAGPLLNASLDLDSTLASLARLSVPFLGDVCLVEEIRHDEVRRLSSAAADAEMEHMLRRRPNPSAVQDNESLVRAVQSGRAEIVDTDTLLGRPAKAMIVPLKARGTIFGAVTFAACQPGRQYGQQDLVLAEDLALRAALAIDNARLYENLGTVARSLQQGLLPERLPTFDGMDIAARYRPAGDGSLIGGDFYDVLPRENGIDLVIGDVTGKGARAAALTAQVRHTVRTAAQYEESPSRILDVINRTLLSERGEGGGRYCTVAFCRLEVNGRKRGGSGGAAAPPVDLRATICCAGHPMPLVMRRDGDVEPVGKPGSVLGWVPDPKLLDVTFELGEQESLVLFTDGVTEARTTGDQYGLAGLEALLRAATREDASSIAGRVDRAAAHAGARRDDVAVLVARRVGTSAG
ncbi:SpoIIE family protein phosphatase [Solirubrobacter sp. CPCC 204708]|uniref:SpoIIE family protein phosphatase n=1 Tax=Solirubrobacter deserti TaxID=2282478 RepID=A0ABT4RRG1_9ACTN|nr:SpoIIE family protein phosphatase [Solirubrobacter deserti]MBE2319303.1 SpoIIE family protein phosphatase [Solirubrobacter deserti]MDA0141169.1 SpoIIE family protein phosphatase [Solirubrobacter deserti]